MISSAGRHFSSEADFLKTYSFLPFTNSYQTTFSILPTSGSSNDSGEELLPVFRSWKSLSHLDHRLKLRCTESGNTSDVCSEGSWCYFLFCVLRLTWICFCRTRHFKDVQRAERCALRLSLKRQKQSVLHVLLFVASCKENSRKGANPAPHLPALLWSAHYMFLWINIQCCAWAHSTKERIASFGSEQQGEMGRGLCHPAGRQHLSK